MRNTIPGRHHCRHHYNHVAIWYSMTDYIDAFACGCVFGLILGLIIILTTIGG